MFVWFHSVLEMVLCIYDDVERKVSAQIPSLKKMMKHLLERILKNLPSESLALVV